MAKVSIFFVFLGMAFGVLFVMELKGAFSQVKDPVAVLTMSDGTVRRLGSEALTWDRAEGGALFAYQDTISTGENASAKLSFYAGGEVELGPGSMVKLGGDLKELKLNFVQGTAKVRIAKSAKNNIKISEDGKSVLGSSSKSGLSRVSVQQVEDSQIQKIQAPSAKEIKEGQLSSTDTLKTDTALNESQKNQITESLKETEIKKPDQALKTDGEIASLEKLPSAPELEFPDNDSIIDLDKNQTASLNWESSENKDKGLSYEVLYRKIGPEGKKGPLKKKLVDQTEFPLSKLGRGRYMWSVRAVSKSGNRSPAAKSRWVEIKSLAKFSKPKLLPVVVE